MVQMLAGFQMSQALYAAARLGIPDALAGGPRTTGEVSAALGTDRRATARLLRSLAGLGVFADAGGDAYALTPLGRTLVGDAPGSMRDLALMWMETHYEPFAGLAGTVRTGRTSATKFYGMPFFGWLSQDHDQVGQFTGAMANLTDGIKRHAVAGYDLGSPSRIVDVGGADGSMLAPSSPGSRAPSGSGSTCPTSSRRYRPWRRRTSSTSA